MKKNVMMRLASFLLVAVLISTSAISGTYAKYVTEGNAMDSARVAKWGVVVTGYADMFDTEYEYDTLVDADKVDDLAVESSTADKLVAPGTKGELTKFTITGQPEVAVKVTYDVTEFKLANWKIASGEYCPIIINVDGTDYYIGGVDGAGKTIEKVADLEAAVIAAIEKHVQAYAPNEDLTKITDDGVAVSWRWAFEGKDHPNDGYQTDPKDTELGDRFTKYEEMGSIHLKVVCYVTQVD